ncbi:MAG: DUF2330 domain-containing protein [Sandaracinaceae bacterium]
MRTKSMLAGAATLALGLAVGQPKASACGGFFCSSSPIDQAGETIVYGLEADGTLTMAVQIRYAGNDDDFAWILPVPAVPEISPGTDQLFDRLRAATEPTFARRFRTEGTCAEPPRCVSPVDCSPRGGDGCGYDGDWDDPEPLTPRDFVDASAVTVFDASASDAGAPVDAGGVTVFSRRDVGPYDTTVLGAVSAREMLDWLQANGYDIPDASEPLLESYAAGGQVFVALRLSSDAETRMIQPIVMRMATDEACLPIRLTAIATVPDMPITAFFLGDARAAPVNYSLVESPADNPGLWYGTTTWTEQVTRRVDRLDGRAFVTEYAGRTPAISLRMQEVADLATLDDPGRYIMELAARGYAGDANLLRLFRAFVVPPEGEDERTYYNCLSRGEDGCGEPASFDPVGLTEAIEAQIRAPSDAAHDLVHRHGYLTRLFTTMSAEEMTVDPVFQLDDGLEDVGNVHVLTRVERCSSQYYRGDAPQEDVLPDGTTSSASEGRRAPSDQDYCDEVGGIPDYEATDCSDPPASSGCGLCTVAGLAPIQGGVLGGLLFFWLARRTRKLSRRS